MARHASSYRWYMRALGFARFDRGLKAQHQRQKRAAIRARFAQVTWAPPVAQTMGVYRKYRRVRGPSMFDAAEFLGKIFNKLSPIFSRHGMA